MIPIERVELPADLLRRMSDRTDKIRTCPAPEAVATARGLWAGSARIIGQPLRATLQQMAPGAERCMYCGDNQDTDVDHFEPVVRNPHRTFDWLNHLLACSFCNSHQKRDCYPVWDPLAGQPVGGPLSRKRVSALRLCAGTAADGRALVAVDGGGGIVRVWDVAAAKSVAEFATGGAFQAMCAVNRPDRRLLLATVGYDGLMRLHDALTSKSEGELPFDRPGGADLSPCCPLTLPDGRQVLAVAAASGVVLWDPASRVQRGTRYRHQIALLMSIARTARPVAGRPVGR